MAVASRRGIFSKYWNLRHFEKFNFAWLMEKVIMIFENIAFLEKNIFIEVRLKCRPLL